MPVAVRGLVAIGLVLAFGAAVPLVYSARSGDSGDTPELTAASTALAPLSDRRIVTGWIPYWDLEEGVDAATSHPKVMADVSTFWYRITSASDVSPLQDNARPESDLTTAITDLHAAGIAVYPTVTDESFSAGSMAHLLGDKSRRADLISSISDMVTRVGADGANIDFEHMNFGNVGSYRTQVKKLFPVFLDKLRQRLHNQDALLSVAVPARRSASDSGWEVFDYNAIGHVVDRAQIMTYDYSVNSPGPIGPYAWTRNVMEYARKEFRGVPLSTGVAQYGRNWYIGTLKGKCPAAAKGLASPTSVQALTLADTYNAHIQWSKDAREFHFDYRRPYPEYGNCVALRRVWFGEARSADERLGLAKKLGLQGIAVWKLGFEDPKMWTRARNVATSITPDAAKVTISSPPSAAAGSPITINTRATFKGVPISSYSVTLQKRVPGKSWSSVSDSVTDSSGRASFDTTINRTLQWRVKVAPAWDWRLSYSPTKRVTVS